MPDFCRLYPSYNDAYLRVHAAAALVPAIVVDRRLVRHFAEMKNKSFESIRTRKPAKSREFSVYFANATEKLIRVNHHAGQTHDGNAYKRSITMTGAISVRGGEMRADLRQAIWGARKKHKITMKSARVSGETSPEVKLLMDSNMHDHCVSTVSL